MEYRGIPRFPWNSVDNLLHTYALALRFVGLAVKVAARSMAEVEQNLETSCRTGGALRSRLGKVAVRHRTNQEAQYSTNM